jgi:hypothetical protein
MSESEKYEVLEKIGLYSYIAMEDFVTDTLEVMDRSASFTK